MQGSGPRLSGLRVHSRPLLLRWVSGERARAQWPAFEPVTFLHSWSILWSRHSLRRCPSPYQLKLFGALHARLCLPRRLDKHSRSGPMPSRPLLPYTKAFRDPLSSKALLPRQRQRSTNTMPKRHVQHASRPVELHTVPSRARLPSRGTVPASFMSSWVRLQRGRTLVSTKPLQNRAYLSWRCDERHALRQQKL